MADPFIGEIRMFAGTFAPQNWALCNGQLMPIAENDALFTLLGTTYGGDGETTFALPNLQGRVPVHQGAGFTPGQLAGAEQVTLISGQLPMHNHTFTASTDAGTASTPPGNVPAALANGTAYLAGAATVALAGASILPDPGGSQPHSNMQPFLCVTFIICTAGIFPSQP